MTTDTLAAYSLLAIYSAAAVYAIAFITSMVDLSGRAAGAQPRITGTDAAGTAAGAPALSKWGRIAFAMTVLAWVLHVVGVVLRGLAAGHAPWGNMYEFAITGVAAIVGVYLVACVWKKVHYLGAYITGLAVLLLFLAAVNVYVDVTRLPPPLQSGWLVIHVFVAILATGFFALGAGLSIFQLLQSRRERGMTTGMRFLQSFPNSEALENLSYRVNVIGFAMWTFTLIAGAIWANFAWGRYWGWDTKEVWTFIIWVVFAGYIHARATRGWRGARSAWLSIIGFVAVLFNFTVVNLFFKGLHAYSGLPTG